MPAYNAARYIGEAIESVTDQEFENWELIIINDGSADHTAQIVEQYLPDTRIRLISQENKRLGAARNTGIRNAKGNWICFLDADDTWLPNKLKAQYRYISAHPETDVVFSDGYTYDQNIDFRLPYHFNVAKGFYTGVEMYQLEFKRNCIPVLSACVKTDWCKKAGYQDEDIQIKGAEDWDYWLRLSLAGATFYGMDERLFLYRVHADSMSGKILTQRTASALILIKNYRKEFLPAETIRRFVKDLIELHNKLIKTGNNDKAKPLAKFVDEHDAGKIFNALKKLFGLKPALSVYNAAFTVKPGMPFKTWIKKLSLRIIGLLFFGPYRWYQKHAHNITIQYYRWHLGNRLETRGYFYISPKAKLNITAKGSKLITYGLHINDYTQINMDRDASYLLTGRDVFINRFCHVTIWEGRLVIGTNVSFNNYCSVSCMKSIEIGDDTWFGEGVKLYDHNHKYKDAGIPFTRQGMTTGAIKIGSNCWIGSNTVILQNVTIGDNCVIGANNLIYRSIPANTIVKAKAMEVIEPVYK